jgi:hypothetical protein
VLKDAAGEGVKAVTLVGGDGHSLKLTKAAGSLAVELPDLPSTLLGQPAWVLKISR